MTPATPRRRHEPTFKRERGIVWVCDIVGSTKYLNSNADVAALETFLPRFHWFEERLVGSAGGRLFNWTGDGFLAWFPVSLDREMPARARAIMRAAWQVTAVVNITQLGVHTSKPFKIRHGITYEPDALISTIPGPNRSKSVDILGRSVVLAFRLTAIPAAFPNIATHKAMLDACRQLKPAGSGIDFRRRPLSREETMQFLKGERWQSGAIYVSQNDAKSRHPIKTLLKKADKFVNSLETQNASAGNSDELAFITTFLDYMAGGPQWAKDAVEKYTAWVRDDLLGNLKRLLNTVHKR